ncbi:HAD-IB family hydrolase [Enterobacterales bacterium CwR94]|nr:HAD-IB family hydrolase [Enterobacterales bacterium CwR94]
MDLALFDLDETLICEDTASLWLRWLESQGFASEEILQRDKVLMQSYYHGSLQIEDYMRNMLAPVAGKATLTVDGWVRRFIHRDILPRVYPLAKERIAFHRDRGDTVIVISANGEHLVSPIAEQLNAHGALAIGVEIVDDCYTGNTYGTFTYKEGKVVRLKEWLSSQHTFNHVWAYSDSHNDIPLLEQAHYAFAVNPDALLHDAARQRGWEVLNWSR